jgi:hypothetical protein
MSFHFASLQRSCTDQAQAICTRSDRYGKPGSNTLAVGVVKFGHQAILPYRFVAAGVNRLVADVVVIPCCTSIYANILQVAGSFVGSFLIGII